MFSLWMVNFLQEKAKQLACYSNQKQNGFGSERVRTENAMKKKKVPSRTNGEVMCTQSKVNAYAIGHQQYLKYALWQFFSNGIERHYSRLTA